MSKEIQNPNDQILHPAARPVLRLLRECVVRRTRRSGPGGQHRNKVETAVIIEHQPTGISAEAGERRSQEENRLVALFRLRLTLAVELRQPVDFTDSPSQLWQGRCRGGRLAVNPRHDDFPALLAEAMDVLAFCEGDIKAAAETLGCTPSQLTKFVQLEPRAIAAVNQAREQRGLHKLK
jgi:hypothetical protein